MSDPLDRAVDAQIDAYRPSTVPPFPAIEARKRGRDRRRLVVGGGVLSALAAVGAVAVVPALTGGGDRVVPAAGGSNAARVTFEVSYAAGAEAHGDDDVAALRRCTGYPGGSRDLQKQSDPPVEAVSVIGGPTAISDFRLCLEELPNTRVAQTGSVPLDRLVVIRLDYRTPVARPQDDPALLECLDGPVAAAPQFRFRQPPIAVLLAGGTDQEVAEVERCLTAVPDIDVTVRDAQT